MFSLPNFIIEGPRKVSFYCAVDFTLIKTIIQYRPLHYIIVLKEELTAKVIASLATKYRYTLEIIM